MSENVTAAVSEATPNSKTKITTKDSALKLAHKRLTVLQLAESLGNVSEACRRGGDIGSCRRFVLRKDFSNDWH